MTMQSSKVVDAENEEAACLVSATVHYGNAEIDHFSGDLKVSSVGSHSVVFWKKLPIPG